MTVTREKQRIGELLRSMRLLDEAQVEKALLLQKEQGIKFGDAVVKLGFLTKDDINWALSNQLNIPYILNLKEQGTFDPESVSILSYEFAKEHCVLILGQVTGSVNVVIADPLDAAAIEYVEQVTGKQANVSIGDERAILDMIEELYKHATVDNTKHYGEDTFREIKTAIDAILKDIGPGFDPEVYKNALCTSLKQKLRKDALVPLIYNGTEIGKYTIDVLIDDSIGIIFSGEDVDKGHIHSLIRLTGLNSIIIIKSTDKLLVEKEG